MLAGGDSVCVICVVGEGGAGDESTMGSEIVMIVRAVSLERVVDRVEIVLCTLEGRLCGLIIAEALATWGPRLYVYGASEG